MENLEKPKPLHEIQPQKIEEIPTITEQDIPKPEVVENQEKQKAIQVEADAKALQKVREELGISKPKEKNENVKDDELGQDFHVLSSHIEDFQSNLRRNQFNRIKLDTDEFRMITTDDKFDPRKASEAVQNITRTFKRGFLPEDPNERMSIESHNFTDVIDSIDDLSARFMSIRKNIERQKNTENEVGYRKLAEDISYSITAMRIKKEELEDANLALRRYRER